MPIYEGSYKCQKCGVFTWCYKIEDVLGRITFTGKDTHNATDHLDVGTDIRINLKCPICGSDYPFKCKRK